ERGGGERPRPSRGARRKAGEARASPGARHECGGNDGRQEAGASAGRWRVRAAGGPQPRSARDAWRPRVGHARSAVQAAAVEAAAAATEAAAATDAAAAATAAAAAA